MLNAGQDQRERPQEKRPHVDNSVPGFDGMDIESVEDLLAELEEQTKKPVEAQARTRSKSREGCGCF